jgi:hypothetical protein
MQSKPWFLEPKFSRNSKESPLTRITYAINHFASEIKKVETSTTNGVRVNETACGKAQQSTFGHPGVL